jgi:hypothetical protein
MVWIALGILWWAGGAWINVQHLRRVFPEVGVNLVEFAGLCLVGFAWPLCVLIGISITGDIPQVLPPLKKKGK